MSGHDASRELDIDEERFLYRQEERNDGEAAQADREAAYDRMARVMARGGASYSGYENAPATILLATHCASCGRPLVDSISVECGMGPDCRDKYGIPDVTGQEERSEANRLVHKIALRHGDAPSIALMQDVERLRELGFTKLADKLTQRCCKIKIQEEHGRLLVWTPFSDQAVALMRTVYGRKWDGERKVNTFPVSSKGRLWTVLKQCFGGQLGYGPKGAFII